jgi:hypothetical protein
MWAKARYHGLDKRGRLKRQISLATALRRKVKRIDIKALRLGVVA